MRVLNVMLSGGLGGIQSAFVNYAWMLRHLDHDVVCCVAPAAAITRFLPDTARVVTLTNLFAFDPVAIARAAILLRRLRPDAIIVHGRRALTLFATARKFLRLDAPLIAVLHRHRFKYAAKADRVIGVTRQLCAEAVAAGIDPAHVIHVPNFIAFQPVSTRESQRHEPPVIGFLGRMVHEKGLDLLLAALKLLRDDGRAFRARIGGDGKLRGRLEAQSAELGLGGDVEWLGWVDAVDEFYDSIDLFCLPSRRESFGLVILQAQRAGKPIVATRTVGASEIIADGVNGSLCAPTPEDIVAKLKTLLDNPAWADRLAHRGRINALKYALPAIAPRVQAVLDDATGRPSAARPAPRAAASGAAN